MSGITIKFENVSKKFTKTLRELMIYGVKDILKETFGIPFNQGVLRKGEFWAIDNISFELKKGETLGIIGPNGAGKTTILKLIAGILLHEKGKIEVNGKVGSLIEIGVGFHPLLTGRENIYVYGAILGMSKREIDEKLDTIIKFADIGDFIDTPVKYYSSGMFVRLGFAIAVHSEPDILLVDEVLAVGDEEYQRKCIKKIRENLIKGVSLVLVSHNLTLINTLCQKVIFLNRGKIEKSGTPEQVIPEYLSFIEKWEMKITTAKSFLISNEAEVVDCYILNSKNEKTNLIYSGEDISLNFKLKFYKSMEEPIFGIIIKDEKGEEVFGTNTNWEFIKTGMFEKEVIAEVIFKQKMILNSGKYYVTFGIAHSEGLTFCNWYENILEFNVKNKKLTLGIVNMETKIEIKKNGK